MLQDDTRQTIKFVSWVIGLIIVAFLASIAIFYYAGSRSRGNDQKVTQLATSKTPIRKIQNYYHLDRGTSSYAIAGTNNKGKLFICQILKRHIYILRPKESLNLRLKISLNLSIRMLQ